MPVLPDGPASASLGPLWRLFPVVIESLAEERNRAAAAQVALTTHHPTPTIRTSPTTHHRPYTSHHPPYTTHYPPHTTYHPPPTNTPPTSQDELLKLRETTQTNEQALRAAKKDSREQYERAHELEAKVASLARKYDDTSARRESSQRRTSLLEAEMNGHMTSAERTVQLERDLSHAREVSIRLDQHATAMTNRAQVMEDMVQAAWEQMVLYGVPGVVVDQPSPNRGEHGEHGARNMGPVAAGGSSPNAADAHGVVPASWEHVMEGFHKVGG